MAKARVENVDVIRAFKIALVKFQEAGLVALSDAEGELSRVLNWLEVEQAAYWVSQHRKRTEAVSKAMDAVRQKKMFKDSTGKTPSAAEEEKALMLARRRLEEAEHKIVAVKRWRGRMQKEIDLYKGQVQRLATSLTLDVPAAIGHLQDLVGALDAYASYGPAGEAAETAVAPASADQSEVPAGASMARGHVDGDDKPVNRAADAAEADAAEVGAAKVGAAEVGAAKVDDRSSEKS